MEKPQNRNYMFFNTRQWGYASSYYQYAQLLTKWGNHVTYVSFDHHLPPRPDHGVELISLRFEGNVLSRQYRLLTSLTRLIRTRNFDGVLLTFFPLAFILRLMTLGHDTVLDVKTGFFDSNRIFCFFHNLVILWNALFFPRVSILSERLRKRLHLPAGRCYDLPLGADYLPDLHDKDYCNAVSCVYVGTFYLRNIDQTVHGFADFYRNTPHDIPLHYDIVGFGTKEDEEKVRKAIEDEQIGSAVTFHGRKGVEECKEFLRKANVGISYIPQIPVFDCQPPTKTFEYIFAGCVCIGTSTTENRLLVKEENGILCQDTPESFRDALLAFRSRSNSYSFRKVTESLKEHQWENICLNKLLPLWEKHA